MLKQIRFGFANRISGSWGALASNDIQHVYALIRYRGQVTGVRAALALLIVELAVLGHPSKRSKVRLIEAEALPLFLQAIAYSHK